MTFDDYESWILHLDFPVIFDDVCSLFDLLGSVMVTLPRNEQLLMLDD